MIEWIKLKWNNWQRNRIRKRFKKTEFIIVVPNECQYIEIVEIEGFKIKKCELELDFVCRARCFDADECENCPEHKEQQKMDLAIVDDFEQSVIDLDSGEETIINEFKKEKSELTKNS